MATIIAFLLRLEVVNIVWNIAVIFTIISGIDYLRKGVLILNAIDAKSNSRNTL